MRRNRECGHALTLIPSIVFFHMIRGSEDLGAMPRDWDK